VINYPNGLHGFDAYNDNETTRLIIANGGGSEYFKIYSLPADLCNLTGNYPVTLYIVKLKCLKNRTRQKKKLTKFLYLRNYS
jgi:hypothetical protein